MKIAQIGIAASIFLIGADAVAQGNAPVKCSECDQKIVKQLEDVNAILQQTDKRIAAMQDQIDRLIAANQANKVQKSAIFISLDFGQAPENQNAEPADATVERFCKRFNYQHGAALKEQFQTRGAMRYPQVVCYD